MKIHDPFDCPACQKPCCICTVERHYDGTAEVYTECHGMRFIVPLTIRHMLHGGSESFVAFGLRMELRQKMIDGEGELLIAHE